jgi:hypothetical protein
MRSIASVACIVLAAIAPPVAFAADEVLYNGIQLPARWPPRPTELPTDPLTPEYLRSPPAVIPIDVGRQLFVDDFLIEENTLERSYHLADYYPGSPVLKPDQPWEASMAMVFSDGVWFDPADKLFKMWYMAGRDRATCHATSHDGIHWRKPALDVKPGTNIVQTGQRDSSTVWLDQEEKDAARRYKMFRSCSGGSTVKGSYGLATFFSSDGIHWSDPPLLTGSCGDRSTVFFNPFRKVWVYSLRHGWGQPRRRRYWETSDLVHGPQWSAITEPPYWVGADSADPMRDDLKIVPQLYNLDCVAYESLLLGLFTIWRGQPENRQKPNELVVGYSRDGWHWQRPDRRAFCAVSERFGDWNYANVQSAGGCCLVVGDRLYFYVSGRGGERGTNAEGICTTGLATLRRDGFASLDADERGGAVTTRPVRFQGKHLFVNVDAPGGELRVELLDEHGRLIPSFSKDRCQPIQADAPALRVVWQGADDLSPMAGKVVRFRFHLRSGKLYAFWVSPEITGASQGYIAAGGPGFTGPIDTVGTKP